jgi:glycosyltransferase involved in cell wall biosynthesis
MSPARYFLNTTKTTSALSLGPPSTTGRVEELAPLGADALLTTDTAGGKPLQVAICWYGVSGYMIAAWKELQKSAALDVSFFVYLGARGYDRQLLTGLRNFTLLESESAEHVSSALSAMAVLRPDVVVLSGWASKLCRRIPHDKRFSQTKLIMTMDTPWRGDVRQRLARYVLGRFLKRMSIIVVAGERTHQYALRLGIPATKIRSGTYCIDFHSFSRAAQSLRTSEQRWPRKFLFVARLAGEKGVDVLMEGYKKYRSMVSDPWSLTVCGKGPLEHLVTGADGVDYLGFVQPDRLPEIFAGHGAFVLTSLYEPWGVVIAEACAAGLPVICTDQCCAAIDLIRNYSNGIVVTSGSANEVARALKYIHEHEHELSGMGQVSHNLSVPFSAEHWAKRWEQYILEAAFPPSTV